MTLSLEQRIATLTPEKRALLEQRLQQNKNTMMSQTKTITRRTSDQRIPLSFGQQRLWFIQQLEAEHTGYNEASAYRLMGTLDLAALRQSFTEIVQRHEILRTTISVPDSDIDGEPVQIIHPAQPFDLPLIDLQHLPQQQWDSAARDAAEALRSQAIDLSRAYPWQAQLLRFDSQTHALIIVRHHIASDGWSSQVFRRELSALYGAFKAGNPSPLPPLPVQYADYASWQREWVNSEEAQKQLVYWKSQLAEIPPISLPTDFSRPPHQSYRGAEEEFVLSPAVSKVLRELSRTTGCSLFMTMLAIFKLLLFRYSGQTDLGVGVSVANRQRPELEPLIGFFVNNLILRTKLEANSSFRELLTQVRQSTLDALSHQNYPFDRLIHELSVERDLSRNPLAQIRFALRDHYAPQSMLADLQMEQIALDHRNARYDLHLRFVNHGDVLHGTFSYNQDLFSASRIRRMCTHLQTLVEAIAADPDAALSDLPLMAASERRQLLVDWNQRVVDFPIRVLHQQVEAQVVRTPDAIAIQDAREQLSYAELNRRANHLAHHLLAQGVTTESPVALLAQRGVNFIVAILAIFKANAAYLPLDPRHPTARHLQILEQSRCQHLLAGEEWIAPLSGSYKAQRNQANQLTILTLEDALQQPSPESNPDLPARTDQLAYILYTSGSTGAPKGAMIEHRGMVNHLWAKVHDLELTAADTVAQTAAQSFDISVWQMLVGLIIGARVQILSDDIVMNSALLLEEVAGKQITILEVVPSLLRAMLSEVEALPTPAQLPALRWLIPTGEALSPALCNQWFTHFPAIPLLNAYGPTECSDDVTHFAIHAPLPAQTLYTPIGKPVANMQAYVLDGAMQPLPIGVIGELWIGGIGVGRGYLNDPERTAAAFLPLPPHLLPNESEANERILTGKCQLYRTGDLARFREDGNLEFLGRIDHQVKVRGFRIELEEIEFVLRQHPSVSDCAVIASSASELAGASRIVAYVVRQDGDTGAMDDLQDFVGKRLPDYMVPATVISLTALPLTANGKLDRAALPFPERSATRPTAYRAPQSAVEKWLTTQMQRFLGHANEIGLDDNFFSMGGDSIRAALFINHLQRELQEILYVVALFDAPTIAQLARYLEQHYPKALARVCDYQPAPTTHPALRIDERTIAQFRQLIPPLTLPKLSSESSHWQRNRRAIFILSAPRSGSTLLRVMLGGHSQLFAPQELDLLNFASLGERKSALQERFSFRLEGLLRAIMEIHRCTPDEARDKMTAYEEQNLETREFYDLLQEWIGSDRILVDKTPAYALDPATLLRAEAEFEEPLYIHLVRHPLGMIQSFEEAHTDQVFFRYEHDFPPRTLAELIWTVSHKNILAFLQEVPAERQLRLRYEDLVQEPVGTMKRVSNLVGLPYEPAMAQPYVDKEKRMTNGLYPVSKMLGDAKFHTHGQIDAANADRWQGIYAEASLSNETWQLATAFGYQRSVADQISKTSPAASPGFSIPRAQRIAIKK